MAKSQHILVPGGGPALAGVGCLWAASMLFGSGAKGWGAAVVALALACFGLAAVQARAARKPSVASPSMSRTQLRNTLVAAHLALAAAAPLAAYGAYLLYQRNTGPHVPVKVTRCELVDPGPQSNVSPHTYCYGAWTYAGRTYTNKYVQGAGTDDEGQIIDATVHGDTAYSRDLQTPLILLGVFGSAALFLLGSCVNLWRRWRRVVIAGQVGR